VAEFFPEDRAASTPRGPLHSIREDVHIHAPYSVVRSRLVATERHREWLAEHFRDYEPRAGGLAFTLALPGRTEGGRLRVDESDPFGVRYLRDESATRPGNGRVRGEIEEIAWALHVETAQDVHLTVEAVYEPRRGLLGPLLEMVVLRPQRIQALRESIWNLKQVIERDYPRQPIF
jgi:hypothetical protein